MQGNPGRNGVPQAGRHRRWVQSDELRKFPACAGVRRLWSVWPA